MNVATTLNYFIPTLYCLHGIHNKMVCRFTEDSEEFLYPLTLNLTFEMLEENGIYLMDLGDSLILYLRKKAEIEDKNALFVQISFEKKIDIEWSEKMSNFLSELTRFFSFSFCK